MKVFFKIYQLQRLGKKQKKFIVRKEEVGKYFSISSKVFGPTNLVYCENFLKKVENEN